uniref:Uncharacterized protein n=1 Tax=Caenorhabditis japonica TaxID=281687 RepID=A0A8R1HRJ0_CAEJA
MSYIGGVMGLFLGMSCITLFEVLVYLVKTVFGTLNNTRHKKLTGKVGSINGGISMAESHEEIIITKKIEKNKSISFETLNDNALPESQGIETRKFSLNPLLENSAKSLKLQIHRSKPKMKRKSVYMDTYDF